MTAEAQRNRRRDIRAGRVIVAHGRIESYTIAECRCSECVAAYVRSQAAKAARRAATPGRVLRARRDELLAQRERCKVGGCEYPSESRGWCNTHYSQYQRGQVPHPVVPRTPPEDATPTLGPYCSVPDCDRPVRAWGWCDTHYSQHRAGKVPGPIRRRRQ